MVPVIITFPFMGLESTSVHWTTIGQWTREAHIIIFLVDSKKSMTVKVDVHVLALCIICLTEEFTCVCVCVCGGGGRRQKHYHNNI